MVTRVQTVFDVKFDLKDFAETGAFTLLYIDVVYIIEIIQRHSDRTVAATIKWENVNRTPALRPGQYKMIAKSYPDNGYTQLINQEVCIDPKWFENLRMNRTFDFFRR